VGGSERMPPSIQIYLLYGLTHQVFEFEAFKERKLCWVCSRTFGFQMNVNGLRRNDIESLLRTYTAALFQGQLCSVSAAFIMFPLPRND